MIAIKTNELIIELLTEMKIRTIFEGKDKIVKMKLTDLQQFCINLINLERKYEEE